MEVDIFQIPGSVFRIRIRVQKAIEYRSRYRKALNTGTASEYRKPLNKDPDHDRKDWLLAYLDQAVLGAPNNFLLGLGAPGKHQNTCTTG